MIEQQSEPASFDIVRRGYDPRQVDDRVGNLTRALTAEREEAGRQIAMLQRRVEELHLEAESAQTDAAATEPSFAGLGARVEQILRLAEEEANELRVQAQQSADEFRALAEGDADRVRAEAEQAAQARTVAAEREAAKVIAQGRKEIQSARAKAEVEVNAKLEEARGLLEQQRAKAAQAAADFEATLAKRRDQSERDLNERKQAAELRLAEMTEQAERMHAQALQTRRDAERRAKDLVETARREADELVTEARTDAERTRRESERELAALTSRRDSINAQLSNLREALATLVGLDPAPAAAAEESPQLNGSPATV